MTFESKPSGPLDTAFRRALRCCPAADVQVESGDQVWTAAGICPASYDPPVLVFSISRDSARLGGPEVLVTVAAGARFRCRLTAEKSLGDHILYFADVEGVEVQRGRPAVRWRGASFQLRLEYPFLENAAVLEDFVRDWRTGNLPGKAWTHAAHIAVTGYYAFDRSDDAVFQLMKEGISSFNASIGGVNGQDSGYHETLTRFWTETITAAVRKVSPESTLAAARCAVDLFGEDRDLPRIFYSFDVMRSRPARREWTPPDLYPPPEWIGLT